MTGSTTSFVAVGDWMSDVVAALPGPLRQGTDTPADVRVLGGGAAANVAAWLGHDRHSSTFVGRIGDDLLGRAGRAGPNGPREIPARPFFYLILRSKKGRAGQKGPRGPREDPF